MQNMSRSNKSWKLNDNFVLIRKVIVNETGEVHKSSCLQMFFKIAILKGFAILLINFIKNRLQHRCFPVHIVIFLRTAVFVDHLLWLLLGIVIN